MGSRFVILLSVLTTLLCCVSCASRSATDTLTEFPAPAALPGLAGLELPAPLDLVSQSRDPRTAAGLSAFRCPGSAADPALAAANAEPAAHRMHFSPVWEPGQPFSGKVSYAMYRFDLSNFYSETSLTLHWRRIGELSNCYIGLADFVSNRWKFLPGADGTVHVPIVQWVRSRHTQTKEMLVVVLLLGQQEWELTSVEAGVPALKIESVTSSPGYDPLETPSAWPGEIKTLFAKLTPNNWISSLNVEWQLAGAELRASWSSSASIRSLDAGSYPCRVNIESPEGDASKSFTLVVHELQPPLITGIGLYQYPPPPPGSPGSAAQGAARSAEGGYSGESEKLIVINTGGPYDTLSWDFGPAANPATSDDFAPDVVWNQPGFHSAEVTATNAVGEHRFSFTLTVEPMRPPELAGLATIWTYDLVPRLFGLSGMFDLSPELTNSGGPVETWDWQFGPDFEPANSSDRNPEVIAQTPGSYECSVTASNAAGSSAHYFTIVADELAVPEIVWVLTNPEQVQATSSVQFIPGVYVNSYQLLSFAWDFGGGCEPNTSNANAPAVSTLAPGVYSCSLQVSNPKGSDSYDFTLEVVE